MSFFCSKTLCQQELDQILERISKMPFRDNRGPLEDLYALHIPNCDKRGQYNLKQVAIIKSQNEHGFKTKKKKGFSFTFLFFFFF